MASYFIPIPSTSRNRQRGGSQHPARAADWISGALLGLLSLPRKIAFPDRGDRRWWRLVDGEGPPNGWKFAWWARFGLVPPELRKPSFCQRRVPGGRLQIAMTETVRQRSSVVTIIGELVSATMTQHVGMDSKGKLGGPSCSLQHP
jgi:hypothetical protein